MRDESKSEIVLEEGCVNRVVKMVIHENGNSEVIQSYHNWIEVCIEHEGGREGKVDMMPGWEITERSTWGQYRDMLDERLRLWRVEREAGGGGVESGKRGGGGGGEAGAVKLLGILRLLIRPW